MKRSTLLLSFLFLQYFAHARTLHLGTGITYSKLDWVFRDVMIEGERHYSAPLVSYSYSLGLEYLEFRNMSVTTDLMFYRSGGKNTAAESSNPYYVFHQPDKIRLDYLSVGTKFNYYPIKKKLSLCLSLGPRFDLIESDLQIAPLNWLDQKDAVNKTNFGLTAGTAVAYTKGDFSFGLGGMYFWKAKKLVENKPIIVNSSIPAGAEASEQILLINVTFAWRIRQYQE